MLLGCWACPGIPPVLPKAGQLRVCLCRIWGVPAWVPPSHLIHRPHSKLQGLCTFSGEVLSKEAFPHPSQDRRSCALALFISPLSCLQRRTTDSNHLQALKSGQVSPSLGPVLFLSGGSWSSRNQPRSHIHARTWPGFLGHSSSLQWELWVPHWALKAPTQPHSQPRFIFCSTSSLLGLVKWNMSIAGRVGIMMSFSQLEFL